MAQTRKLALISGGSSGIGLECARILLARGYRTMLVARDADNLREAVVALSADAAPDAVEAMAFDVRDAKACQRAVAEIVARGDTLDWLITCAGIVEPGYFEDLSLESHRRQMETNYFGTLHLVQPVAALMRVQGGGRITLVSSGAAFVGIAGYAGYAPGKFAVRALGETLRVELAPFGVSVSVAFPPDTDTRQLAQENLTKPAATKAITAGGGVWPAPVIARRLLDQAEAGRFMLTPSLLMSLFGWLHSLYAPAFLRRQISMLKRYGRT